MKKKIYFSAVLAMGMTVMGGFASCSSDNEEVIEAPVAKMVSLDVEFEQPVDVNGTRVSVSALKLSLEDGDKVRVYNKNSAEYSTLTYSQSTNKLEGTSTFEIADCMVTSTNLGFSYGYSPSVSPYVLRLFTPNADRYKAGMGKLPSAILSGKVNADGTKIKLNCIDAIIKIKFSNTAVSSATRGYPLYFVPNIVTTDPDIVHPVTNVSIDASGAKASYDYTTFEYATTGYSTISDFGGSNIPMAGETYYFPVMPLTYNEGVKLIYGNIDTDGNPAGPALYKKNTGFLYLRPGYVYDAGEVDHQSPNNWTVVTI